MRQIGYISESATYDTSRNPVESSILFCSIIVQLVRERSDSLIVLLAM